MKVLFLDIDGVLNNGHIRSPRIDPAAIEILNYVLEQTEAKIVVSSMWRRMFNADDLGFILSTHGLKFNVVEDTTPPHPDRSKAIKLWIERHVGIITSWVVVDDEFVDVLPAERCIRTDMHNGLTWQDAEQLITMLNTNWLGLDKEPLEEVK